MKVAVIGNGGREHTLAWKLGQSPSVEKVYVLPGSDAMASVATCVPIPATALQEIADFCVNEKIELIVVGPEAPLTAGLVDCCRARGLAVFGPTKEAAQLEGSKAFAKDMMKKYHIPTAAYEIFADGEKAKAYVRSQGAPIVVKADGLAAGKGVVVAQTVEEAIEAIDAIMEDKVFGEAGGKVVIEECMVGEEASILAFVDGHTIVPMVAAQDHKRIFDGDKGPNTGGMGAYAPAPIITEALQQEVVETIIRPMVEGLAKEGIIYTGCLYTGLMITKEGPKVVEFNARFGDPETQVVLPLLEGDLAQIMYACTNQSLRKDMVHWKASSAACVILASKGYPQSAHKGDVITGLDKVKEGVAVFHSGTTRQDDAFVTNGGRVLGVVGLGDTLQDALSEAYEAVDILSFEGKQVRRDIGAKGLK